jgi:spore coat protein U-like protein
MRKIVLAVSLLLTLGLVGGAAYAATATGTLNVSATVVPTCSISTTAVNFGNYDGNYNYTYGDITVTCAQGAPYHIALDCGQNYRGGGERFISSDVGILAYMLYQDKGYSAQWGDVDYNASYPYGKSLADTGNGADQAHTVYGVLLKDSMASPGTYTDVVNVTIYY